MTCKIRGVLAPVLIEYAVILIMHVSIMRADIPGLGGRVPNCTICEAKPSSDLKDTLRSLAGSLQARCRLRNA